MHKDWKLVSDGISYNASYSLHVYVTKNFYYVAIVSDICKSTVTDFFRWHVNIVSSPIGKFSSFSASCKFHSLFDAQEWADAAIAQHLRKSKKMISRAVTKDIVEDVLAGFNGPIDDDIPF